MNKIDSVARDPLIEIVNIGAGNASTALSKMVGAKVDISVPDAVIDTVENISSQISHSEDVSTIVLMKMGGDISGVIMLVFPPNSAYKLAKLLIGDDYSNIGDSCEQIHNLNEMEKSALLETGNIIAGSALTALSNFLDLNILESIPESVTDMLGSAINSITAELGHSSESVLFFKVNFKIEGQAIGGDLFFAFDADATQKILNAINKKFVDYEKKD